MRDIGGFRPPGKRPNLAPAAAQWPQPPLVSRPAARYVRPMSMRIKKFIGMLALLVILFVYALLVMSLAVRILPAAGPVAEFIFYAVAGIAWVVPTKYLIIWMNTPGKSDASNS